ncbi:MAG: mucoidy inhibitor MuiA family protein [Holophagales bacterium]|jgi:uncharacterized protein (TIGR02231 family)|nr:mucoidy inhibitor MuiA family protein [Holophagales bacterium]
MLWVWRFGVFASVFVSLSAQAPIGVTAPIQRVRLHPDEAWVTRVGRAKIQSGGTYSFLVSDLPSGLGIQDVRVSAKGPSGTRLGDFAIGTDARKITESPDYIALKKERDTLRDTIDALEADIEALDMEAKFLNELSAAYSADISAKVVSGTIDGASVVDLSTSLSARLAAVLTKGRKHNRELSERTDEIRRLDVKTRQMASARNVSPSRAAVEITVQRPGDVEIELSYRTRQARWTPAYEARLAADDRGLELALFASVMQTSGEDWSNVVIEITNARASRNLAMPTLPGAQIITWSEPRTEDSAVFAAASGTKYPSASAAYAQNMYVQSDSASIKDGQGSEQLEAKPAEAETLEEIKGLASTWSLEGFKDVPSDGEPHKFRVISADISPVLALLTVPRIDTTVYRVARFPIPSGIPLFPGAPIAHFAGTQRVGEAPLVMPSAGRPIQLGFGPYRGIRAALNRLDAKKESVGTFTKEIQWTLQERFELSNDLNERVTVEVQDRELKSGNDRVRVLFQPDKPPETEAQTPGVHCWKIDLQPKSTINMPFTYQIRIPQGQGRVSGIENLNLPN